ncbi:hypothetical protein N7540_007816 [Neofusicoccum parvum]|uniref:Uncharacterized protein n=1 Tax=Neofusicoccum parvum TaxID=310453 RepID=A0ACB5SGP0_9PEZI|nr:hypothetical protein N7540_007816 [Neofusicoccum parvum]
MTSPRVLLLGGNGRTARVMTPLLLARSWHVTSVVRQATQHEQILRLAGEAKSEGQQQPLGSLDVAVVDLADIRSDADALALLRLHSPTYVVWAAGTVSPDAATVYAVDRDAYKHVINACAAAESSTTKFLAISFPAARRRRAPWWDDRDYAEYRAETAAFPAIQDARAQADRHLAAVVRRTGFQAVSLRPSWLTDGPPAGRWIILTFGWGNSISKDVLGLHHRLEAARQALASAHAELDAASRRATTLAHTKAGLDAQLVAGATAAHCIRVQRGFAGYNDTATQLLLKIRGLHNRATTVEISIALLGVSKVRECH